jgi:prepilin-type N-terminal cleavage/methylation domain-containing protein
MKYLQRLKSRKGLTLVEVIIATAIFSLILVAVFSMYQPLVDVANMISADSDMQRVVSAGEQFVVQQLRNSPEIVIHHDLTNLADIQGLGGAVTAFMGTGINAKTSADDNPQALIILDGILYNVSLSGTTWAAETASLASLSRWRVFNPTFYAGLTLEYQIGVSPSNPHQQVRGDSYLEMQVDALRGTSRDMNSRSRTQLQLVWIGKIQGAGCSHDDQTDAGCITNCGVAPDALRMRSFPALTPGAPSATSATGAIVIFYNNNEIHGRAVRLCHFCHNPMPCANSCTHICPHIAVQRGLCPCCPCLGTCGLTNGTCTCS